MIDVPTDESIDAGWLTAQLRSHGFAAEVKDFTRRQIGTGQIGKCIRYEMDIDGDSAAPRSLIGKFPSDDPLSRATGVALRNFLKEVSFYQQLQSSLRIRTPRCYFAQIKDEGPEFMLLLEDLSPAEQGNQLAGCSETVARAALSQLVGLHAPSWNDARLLELDWLGQSTPESGAMVTSLYNAQLPGFMERFGDKLDADQRAIITAFGQSSALQQRSQSEPFALVHIDFRLDNLLIDETGPEPIVTTVDWQSITVGNPMTDVAYFIGAGLLADTRRSAEDALVREYHQALLAAGIADYAWTNCWEDYRRATFAGFSVTVVASMLVQQTERGDEMFTAMAQRHSRHALDHKADELI
jgi:hypothetical protein